MNKLKGTLKQLAVVSKTDENDREITTITLKVQVIEGNGWEEIEKISDSLNKPIQIAVDALQLGLPKRD